MARPPFTFDRNTLGSNGSFLLRFTAGRPFARAAHLKNAGNFTASLQEGTIRLLHTQGPRPMRSRALMELPAALVLRCARRALLRAPTAAANCWPCASAPARPPAELADAPDAGRGV